MNIRKATPQDVNTLQKLNDEIFVDNSQYDPDIKIDWANSEEGTRYFTDLVNDTNAICLIAEEDGKPIGYIAAAHKEIDYRNSKYIEIENMGVSPDYRSKGVGQELMKRCIEIAKAKGYQKAFVNSYIKNTKAVEFYKKNGFEEIDVSLEKKI